MVRSIHLVMLGYIFSVMALGSVALAQDTEVRDADQQEESPAVVVIDSPENEASDEQDSAVEQDAVEGERSFVVYVIRHAEKEDSDLDPGLTRDGYRRADGLAQLLGKAGVEAIYSTYYRRNVGTVLPLARNLSTPVQFYHEDNADDLVERVLARAETTVIVGHSNTVPDLVRAFGGDAESMTEEDYGDLFQLSIDVHDGEHEVRQVHLQAPLLLHKRS